MREHAALSHVMAQGMLCLTPVQAAGAGWPWTETSELDMIFKNFSLQVYFTVIQNPTYHLYKLSEDLEADACVRIDCICISFS